MNRFKASIAAITFGLSSPVFARTPPQDSRPQFFAGEWIGLGKMNQFCRMELNADGTGALQKRNPNGSWTRLTLKWHNSQQTVVIDEPTSIGSVENQANGTFKLVFKEFDSACQMQRKSDFDRSLEEALKPKP